MDADSQFFFEKSWNHTKATPQIPNPLDGFCPTVVVTIPGND